VQKKRFMRIMPYIFVLYIISFLDRVNVGYAALSMNNDLGFSNAVYGLGAGIFFIGYFIMEIPGNLIMARWSARLWIARILITWGIIAGLTAFIHTPWQFYTVRFLLGLAEASFMPGIIYYLSCWFQSKEQARAVALFMLALPVCSIIGGPVSTYLLGVQWLNLAGWQWLFILEAAPAVIFGLITPFYLTDKPEQAKWLTAEERNWLINRLNEEVKAKKAHKAYTLRQAFTDRDVIVLALIYFFWVTGFYGFNMWLPTIVKGLSGTFTNQTVGWIVAIPYLGSLISMILISRHSDQTGERRRHTMLTLLTGGIGLGISMLAVKTVGWQLVFFTVAAMGIYGAFGPFWALPGSFLTEVAAAGAIALINSVGNLGGFVGPYVVGFLKNATGTFTGGAVFLVICLVVAGLLPALLRRPGHTTYFDKRV
jgi:ACS family tartrate transporter-like MFS transporter